MIDCVANTQFHFFCNMSRAESAAVTVVPLFVSPTAGHTGKDGLDSSEQAQPLSDSDVDTLYTEHVEPLVNAAFGGNNGAVIAYGDGLPRERAMLCMPGASHIAYLTHQPAISQPNRRDILHSACARQTQLNVRIWHFLCVCVLRCSVRLNAPASSELLCRIPVPCGDVFLRVCLQAVLA